MTIVDNYASGQLSVSGSGVSSAPTAFTISAASSATVNVIGTAFRTMTSLSTSASPTTYGQTVKFTATVQDTASYGGVPTGGVEFFDGTTDLGPGTPLGGSGTSATSTFRTATLAAGNPLDQCRLHGDRILCRQHRPVERDRQQALVSVVGITAANKVYDDTATATLEQPGATLLGVLNGDTVDLDSAGATGNFVVDSVGTGIR